MTLLEIILLCTTIACAALAAYALRLLYRIGLAVLRVEDTLEGSLSMMDERIDSMQKILDVPLFSDSPEIRRIHMDMQECRDSLIDVANALTAQISEPEK